MTDHKESANSYLGACIYETHGITNEEKVSLAQVHATLYLAEQQRIANLIAYSAGQQATLEIDVQIREGLGI